MKRVFFFTGSSPGTRLSYRNAAHALAEALSRKGDALRRLCRFEVFLVLASAALPGVAQPAPAPSETPRASEEDPETRLELRGGLWFDGEEFRHGTWYVSSGRLTRSPPAEIDCVLDLSGLFLVPPFGDAHAHHFDSKWNTQELVDRYLEEGIFYAKVLGNSRTGAEGVADLIEASPLEVVYAHGALTSSFSHPIELYEAMAMGYFTVEEQKEHAREARAARTREGNNYHIVDTEEELRNKWARILGGDPDLIKIYLRESNCYDELGWPFNPGEWTFTGGGVDPDLVPLVVELAHEAELPVTASAGSAFDVGVALASGVDEISHLPGYQTREDACESSTDRLHPWDAKLAADRGVHFVLIAGEYEAERPPEVMSTLFDNYETLRRWRVPLAIGSNRYGHSPLQGVLQMAEMAPFSNSELLTIWTSGTAHAIFPDRLIGNLEEGYEASFLGLRENPLQDFEAVTEIALRIKNGIVVGPADRTCRQPRSDS